jgi:hypothetical protein
MKTNTKSLWEYLGYPAGSELGNIVYQAAKADKIKVSEYNNINNPVYKGKVWKYPVEWLNENASWIKNYHKK